SGRSSAIGGGSTPTLATSRPGRVCGVVLGASGDGAGTGAGAGVAVGGAAVVAGSSGLVGVRVG
ncbi:MAG: hypothetical protein RIF41_12415, partial [Polyangiaceae bacterium]